MALFAHFSNLLVLFFGALPDFFPCLLLADLSLPPVIVLDAKLGIFAFFPRRRLRRFSCSQKEEDSGRVNYAGEITKKAHYLTAS